MSEATKIYNQILNSQMLMGGSILKIIPITEEEIMSETAEVKRGSLLVRATNLPTVVLAILFYILSIAFVSHVIIIDNKMSNIDATFQQVGQAINQQAKVIEGMGK